MKKSLFVFVTVLLCILVIAPMTAFASTYTLTDTDMSIQLDDSIWYVFTRDNIKDNPELEELGSSYNDMYEFLHNNHAYMDAVLFYETGEYTELVIRKKALDSGVANLANYSDKEVLELAEELADKQNAGNFSVYTNQYKFVQLKYTDSGFYLCEFITVINKDNYTFTFQSETPFIDSDYKDFENIVDSISFDVDTSLKENRSSSFWSSVAAKVIGGAAVGAIVGGVTAFINNRKKKKDAQADNTQPSDTPDVE